MASNLKEAGGLIGGKDEMFKNRVEMCVQGFSQDSSGGPLPDRFYGPSVNTVSLQPGHP